MAKRFVVSVDEVAETDNLAVGVEVARPILPLLDSTIKRGVVVP